MIRSFVKMTGNTRGDFYALLSATLVNLNCNICHKLDYPNSSFMSGDTQKPRLPHDDIDLIVLLERGISFFKKYKWIFIVAIITGLIAGFLWYSSLPKVYKSRMVLQPTTLTNQNAIQIVANWNTLLKSGEHAALSATFNCKEDILSKVKEIKAEEIQKIFTPNNPNGFILNALVTDVSTLDNLQKGILYGFNNSESVKDKLDSKRNRLRELIDKTNTEIQRLDSTNRTVENILNGNRSGSSLMIDVSGISRQIIELNEKHLFFKEELKFTNAIQVLQGFSKFKKPIGPNLFVWLFLGLASCLSIAFLYTLFSSINQKLKRSIRFRKER